MVEMPAGKTQGSAYYRMRYIDEMSGVRIDGDLPSPDAMWYKSWSGSNTYTEKWGLRWKLRDLETGAEIGMALDIE